VRARGWTARACLPGGDLYGPKPTSRAVREFAAWVAAQQQRFAWVPPALVARWARAYGTRIEHLLANRCTLAGLGPEVVPGLYAAEVEYLMEQEWAHGAADVLWRRSKLGLHLAPGCAGELDAWMAARYSKTVVPAVEGSAQLCAPRDDVEAHVDRVGDRDQAPRHR